MAATKFLCWTDLSNRRYYAPADQVMVSIPGRSVIDEEDPKATVYMLGGGASAEGISYSDTSPGSIFTVPTFYEALNFIKTGDKGAAYYGDDV